MAAAKGNQYAAKERVWAQAINNALEKRGKKGRMEVLESLADKLIDKCLEGDMTALKELGDRMEGKPAQAITGEGGGPIEARITWQSDNT